MRGRRPSAVLFMCLDCVARGPWVAAIGAYSVHAIGILFLGDGVMRDERMCIACARRGGARGVPPWREFDWLHLLRFDFCLGTPPPSGSAGAALARLLASRRSSGEKGDIGDRTSTVSSSN